MKSPTLAARLAMALCATLLLCVQVLGLHYHRHAHALDVPAEGAISVHLWDGGLHSPATAVAHDHAVADAHAAHPGADVDVDQLAIGLAKLIKLCMAAGLFFIALLWLMGLRLPASVRRERPAGPVHPDLFVLRPPSNAPPLELSPVR